MHWCRRNSTRKATGMCEQPAHANIFNGHGQIDWMQARQRWMLQDVLYHRKIQEVNATVGVWRIAAKQRKITSMKYTSD